MFFVTLNWCVKNIHDINIELLMYLWKIGKNKSNHNLDFSGYIIRKTL